MGINTESGTNFADANAVASKFSQSRPTLNTVAVNTEGRQASEDPTRKASFVAIGVNTEERILECAPINAEIEETLKPIKLRSFATNTDEVTRQISKTANTIATNT